MKGELRYAYEVKEVDGRTYDRYGVGDLFNGGIVVDGLCDGEWNVLLLVIRYEVRTGMQLVCELPIGWSVKFAHGLAVACHPEQCARAVPLNDISKPFDEWEELKPWTAQS